MGGDSSSSSGEEDGDAEWRAAINSVSAVDLAASTSNGSTRGPAGDSIPDDEPQKKVESRGLKLYQVKAQKVLNDILEKSLEMVRDHILVMDDKIQKNEGTIRLFRKAPPGLIVDPIDAYRGPRKRPKIIPGEEINEKTEEFMRQLQSVAVDGSDIIALAKEALRRSLARSEARDLAAKAAVKREEERVSQLKRLRGEKWLPSIAREMQLTFGQKEAKSFKKNVRKPLLQASRT